MLKIGFIGAGKMAQALAKGFLAAGLTKGEKIVASDPFPTCLQEFQRLGGRAATDNCDLVKCSEVVFIAVKPAVVPTILAQVNPFITTNHLVISIAMGISIADIEKGLPPATRVIRMMPNTPVLVRSGASVFVCGSATNSEDEAVATRLLESVGICYKVPESLINPITALSGSGPAYMYIVIEALADGAVKMGMPRDLAYRLAAQTVVGAGNMVLSTNIHPGQLKDDVASPAGSTSEGLHFLEKHGLRAAFIGAIEAATLKCQNATIKINKRTVSD